MDNSFNVFHPTASLIQEASTIFRGAGLVFLGTSVGFGLRYILDIVIAQNLGRKFFGLFFLGFAVFKIAGIITELGLSSGIVRYVAVSYGQNERGKVKGTILLAIKSTCVASILVGLAVFLFSELLSIHIFRKFELTPVLKCFSLILPFTVLSNIIFFSFQGLRIMKYKIYIGEIFEPIFKIFLVTIAFFMGFQLLGVLWSYFLAAIVISLLSFYFLKRAFPPITEKTLVPVYQIKALLRFSWPMFFVNFMVYLFLWLDTLILGILRTSDEVGLYSAAQRTAIMSSLILNSFHTAFAPVMADFYAKNQQRDLEYLFKWVNKWILSITIPVTTLTVFFSSFIMTCFGPNFIQGSTCLIILSFGWLAHSSVGSTGILLTMSGRSKIHLLNISVLLLLSTGLNFLLVSSYGISGAAIATTISLFLLDLVTSVETYLLLRIHPFTLDFLKPIFAGIIAILPIYVLVHMTIVDLKKLSHISILSCIYLMMYFFLICFLGIKEEEKLILRRILFTLRMRTNIPFQQ